MGAGAPYIAQIIPELRVHFPDLPDPPGRDSEGARFRLFDAVSEFIRKASQRRAIVLVLDDLHAADVPSLLLLQFLARELGSMRMLVLGAYRDVDPIPGEPLPEMRANVARASPPPQALRPQRESGGRVHRADGVRHCLAVTGRRSPRGDGGEPALRR